MVYDSALVCDLLSRMTSCFQDDDDDVTLTRFGRAEGGGWNVPPTDYDSEASTDFTYGRRGEFTIVLIQPTGWIFMFNHDN